MKTIFILTLINNSGLTKWEHFNVSSFMHNEKKLKMKPTTQQNSLGPHIKL